MTGKAMGSRTRIATWLRVLCLVATPASYVFASDDGTLDALEAGLNSWLAEVEFRCSYTYCEWLTNTREEAEHQPAPSRLMLKSHGDIIKLGENTLYSCTVETDDYPTHQLGDFVAVISDELEASYVPVCYENVLTGKLVRLFVSRRDSEYAHLPYPRHIPPSPSLDPLTYGGGKDIPNYISLGKKLKESGLGTFSWNVKSADERRIQLEIVFRTQYDTDRTTLTFNLQHSYPIVEEVNGIVEFEEATSGPFHSQVVAAGFVAVEDGLYVPSSIRCIEGPLKARLGESFRGKWRVQLWESSDIGKVSPRKDDFVIELNPGTSVLGFHPDVRREFFGKSKAATRRVFDINSFSIDDLLILPESDVPREERPVRTLVLVLGNVAVILVIVAVVIIRRRRSRAA